MPSDELTRAIHEISSSDRITTAMRRGADLPTIAALHPDPLDAAQRLTAATRDGDDVTALAAVHALGAVAHPLADETLIELVRSSDEPFTAHAAWALGARRSSPAGVTALEQLADAGAFPGMLAERTLHSWGQLHPDPPTPVAVVEGAEDGVVVIQPFLHARLDRTGSTLGVGDAGGIASLLRSLGTSLAGVDGVAEVVTVTRRHVDEPRTEWIAPGHRVVRIDVGDPGPLPWREAWVHRVAIEQQLHALGEALSHRPVVWHLRMADVGTLAASGAARRLGQPVVFTAAPDPHIVIDALEDAGQLDRARFGVEDAAAQYWFRARMVERLSALADRLALLPRPTLRDELVELLGVERDDLDERAVDVPEGVDVTAIDAADERRARMGAAGSLPPVVTSVLEQLPPERRALPWVLTVGRLNPTKGPQRIVEAVAGDDRLRNGVNVIVVGGDLDGPSPDERSTIELISRAAFASAAGSVVLTGHLPPAAVADLHVHVAATGGVYVAASDKEEFGLAIVEALAAGTTVVAPARGGPRTYVVDGDTGILCDTMSVPSLRDAIDAALDRADDVARADRARRMVREELSVEQMADRLGALYRELVPVVVGA